MQLRLAAAVTGLILLICFTFVWRPPQADSQIEPPTELVADADPPLLIAPPPEDLARPGSIRRTDRLIQPAVGSTLSPDVELPLPLIPVPQAGSSTKAKPRPNPARVPRSTPRPVEAGSGVVPRRPPALRALPVPEAGSVVRKPGTPVAMPRTVVLATGIGPRPAPEPTPSTSTLAKFLVISPDGSQLAVGDANGEIRLLDVATKAVARSFKLESGTLLDLLYTPDGALLASATGNQLLLFDTATGDIARRYKAGETYFAMGLLPNGEHIIAVSPAGRVVRLSLTAGDVVEIGWHGGGDVTAFALSSSGRFVATGGNGGAIRIWSLESPGSPTKDVAVGTTVRCLAFSPDDRRLASSCSDTRIQIRVIDRDQGPFLEKMITARSLPNGLQFGRDPGQLFVSSLTTTAAIARYDFTTGALTQLTDSVPAGTLRDFAISPDGLTLAALTRDRAVHVFTLDPRTSTVQKQSTINAAAP
jgi:eukaryotic-like serine/threonine-protein kinase